MKRIFLLTLATAVAGFATVANSASLSVVADAASYTSGDAITLTVEGHINPTIGDATTNIDVRVSFTNSSFTSLSAETATNPPPMFGPATNWTVGGSQGTIDENGALTVFNQIQGLPPGGPFVNNCNGAFTDCFVSATVVMTAGAPGTAVFDFATFTSFFGEGPQAGTTATINAIPEPTTAALMGLGLLGLAAAGRRRL